MWKCKCKEILIQLQKKFQLIFGTVGDHFFYKWLLHFVMHYRCVNKGGGEQLPPKILSEYKAPPGSGGAAHYHFPIPQFQKAIDTPTYNFLPCELQSPFFICHQIALWIKWEPPVIHSFNQLLLEKLTWTYWVTKRNKK